MELRGSGTLRARQRSIRRVTFLALLLLAVAAPAGFVLAGEQSLPYIVIFKDDAVTKTVTETQVYLVNTTAFMARHAPGKTRREVDGPRVRNHVAQIQARIRVRVGNVYATALGGFSANLTGAQKRALQLDPAVAAIVRDEEIELDEGPAAGREAGGIRTTANTGGGIPAGIRRVGAQRNTLARVDGRDTRVGADVAIIDTGVERDHPDLNVVGGYNCTSPNRQRWDDVDGHGTHVAGIVGALDNRFGVVGVAPGVRIWSVKVLGPRGSGRMSWLVCGIDWVTSQRDRGNPSRPLFEVANMSISYGLPGGKDRDCGRPIGDAVHMAVCRSVARGTVYVAAAGNEGRNARLNRPAAFDEVITVSAMADYDGRGGGRGVSKDSCPYWSPERDDAFTTFSNFGADVDLIAPGRCVLSTFPRKKYAWMSGTSMAAPHVSGAAAIYRAMYPRATPQQVRMALLAVGTRDWRTSTDRDRDHEKAVGIGGFRTMPDFSTSTGVGSGSVEVGGQLNVTVGVTRMGGFTEPVSVDLAEPVSGISALPATTIGDSVTLGVKVARHVTPGRYQLHVRSISGDIERTSVVYINVRGAPPRAAFSSPTPGETFQSTGSVAVSWTESSGGAEIVGRTLERQSGPIRTPGTCAGVRYTTDYTRPRATTTTERTASGNCYRWSLTLTDSAGYRSTSQSGAVLVDTSAPRAPSVGLPGTSAAALDLTGLGVDAAYLGHSGMLWVRGSASGSVDLEVTGYDAESGVASNVATVDRASGWRATWVGDAADGALRLFFTAAATNAQLKVSSTNRAGLAGASTVGRLSPDSVAPSSVVWVSAPSDTVLRQGSSRFALAWSGGADAGSGLAHEQWVVRYRAPLNARGDCRSSAFALDSDPELRTDASTDTNLADGACYVWGVRTLDNVGNAAPIAWSGFVIIESR